jgi:4-methyl-5(b-hydroxyethyl)-thiazole monophosphate biosynthesis
MSTVIVPLAEGFEEIEAVTIIDVLRRADVNVIVTGHQRGVVRGSHGIAVEVDRTIAEVDPSSVTMVVLPGGMPGAERLARDPDVQGLVRAVAARAKVAAICAAPMALAAAGVVAGKTATVYPGFEDRVTGARVVQDRVVVDGNVVTGRGVGAAIEFSLTLVGILRGATAEAELAKRMLVVRPQPARVVEPT